MTIDEIKRQIFIDSEEVCGNTMIDIYQAEEYVEQAYNKAIDDFVKAIVDRGLSANDDKYCITHYDNYLKVIKEIAEQMKGR